MCFQGANDSIKSSLGQTKKLPVKQLECQEGHNISFKTGRVFISTHEDIP